MHGDLVLGDAEDVSAACCARPADSASRPTPRTCRPRRARSPPAAPSAACARCGTCTRPRRRVAALRERRVDVADVAQRRAPACVPTRAARSRYAAESYAALGRASHVISSAARPRIAAHVWSASTATPPHGWNLHGGFGAASRRRCLTPGHRERARRRRTRATLPPTTGGRAITAISMPGSADVGAVHRRAGDDRRRVDERQRRLADVRQLARGRSLTVFAWAPAAWLAAADELAERQRALRRPVHDRVVARGAGRRRRRASASRRQRSASSRAVAPAARRSS